MSEPIGPSRMLICPSCNMTLFVDPDAELPEEGPICAMGHDETSMINSVITNPGQG